MISSITRMSIESRGYRTPVSDASGRPSRGERHRHARPGRREGGEG
jgi:hypothetical protein